MMDDVAILEILILSNLRAGAVHGYELKNRVQRPTATKLSNNSLYPILRRFEEDGSVTRTREEQEGRPARNTYAITERGRSVLHSLLSTLPPGLASNEEEFLVRLGFFDELEPAARRSVLLERIAALDARAEQVRALETAASETVPAKTRTDAALRWRSLAMGHLLEGLENEKRWVAGLLEETNDAQSNDAQSNDGENE
jgi:DNA-binding PadR family transcriptional regulator